MATVAKKVKVEPLPDGHGSFQTNRIKIKTEDGETIYIKKEKEDNIESVIDTTDYETVEVKTEKTDDTLLRSALAGPPKPIRRGKQYLQFIEKVSSSGKKRNADFDLTSSEEEEVEEEVKTKEQQSKTESERSQQIIEKLMQMQKSDVRKSKDDSGKKDNDGSTKSTKIKIVFDPSGKLKEWRIDKNKDKDSSLQPTNLGKILMFANMMKNSSNNDPTLKRKEDFEEQKSTANLDMIKSIAQQQFKKKKVGIEDFIVGPDFQSFQCKICNKEFLNRSGLTTHMKLHHLSLSGMPGSSLFNRNKGKTEAGPPNVAKNVAAAVSAISSFYTPSRQVTATVSKPSPEVVVHPPKDAVIVKESLRSEKSLPQVISHPSKKTTTNPEILFLPTKKTASGQQIVQLPAKTSTTVMHGQASPVSSILSSMIKSESPPRKSVIKTEPSASSSSTNVRPVTMVATNDMTNVTPGNVISKASSTKFTPITDKMFHCEICPKMYNTADMLAQHVLAHNRERPFMCGLCDNRYLLHNDLEAHLLTHADPDEQTTVLFTCSHCDEEYDTDRQLQEHLKIHSDVETETVYECGMCGTELNSQTELQIHMKRHIKNAFEPCKCGICKASFHRVEALKSHIAKEHFPQTEYMCNYCKCRFMNKDALKRHMPVHEQTPDSKVMKFAHRWKCRYCIQRYEYKPDMITHMRLEHPQSRFFDCSFCETSFFTKEDLQAHVKTHSVVAHFL